MSSFTGELRTRVAVPVSSPMVKPSLIPVDVLQEAQREEAEALFDPEFDNEPNTAPVMVGNELVLGMGAADHEVAMFTLSQVPLFRNLPVRSLERLAAGAQQVDVPDQETLFVEGDDAQSFFVVIDGTLEVIREKEGRHVTLRHASKGEAFGLFGLFAGRLRAASARAIGDCSVLEITSEKLQEVVAGDAVLHEKLLEFYRERLVEGFLSSKLFSDLIDSVARGRVIGRFKHVELEAGTTVMEPGEVSNLLIIVTHGQLMLEERARAGEAPRHFEVSPGQYVMVASALSGSPARLKVVAPVFSTLSMIEHRDFAELLRDYPALRSLPNRLPGYARAVDRDVFCGETGVPGL